MKQYYRFDAGKPQRCTAKEFVGFWNKLYRPSADEPYYCSLFDQKANLKPGLTNSDIETLLWWKFRPFWRRFYNPAVAMLNSLNRFRHLTAITQEEERNFWQETTSVAYGGIRVQAFLFHISRPDDYAILDQHVMRAYLYLTSGIVRGNPLQGGFSCILM